MKINPWTLGLAAAGVVSLASAVQAEEATESVKTLVSSTTLSGYVNTSVHWNPGSAAAVGGYNYSGGKADGFNLNVVDIAVAKPLDEGEWSAGYKAEFWFGPDAAGLGNAIAAGANASSVAIKNAYVALRAPLGNGLDFKLGIFDTIVGYESHNAGENPNYTRSWGNSLEPIEHTGLLASYRFNDIVSASAGIANAYNDAINLRAQGGGVSTQTRKTYMGAITLTAPDSLGFLKGGTLTAGVVDGQTTFNITGPGAAPDVTHIYVGATVPTPIESLKVGAAWDHRNLDGLTDSDSIAGYLSFQATEKLKINLRGDYLDDGGAFFGGNSLSVAPGVARGTAGAAPLPLATGTAEIVSFTATVDYALWANVISRLEYRWDHDLSDGQHFGGTLGSVGGRNNAQLLALNVIYKF